MKPRIAVLGATGMVGRELLQQLEGPLWRNSVVTAIASKQSRHTELPFGSGALRCITVEEAMTQSFDIVLASAGAALSTELSPRFAEGGAVVIDNSSAFRMDPEVPLVVPEINGHTLTREHRIIANPNCSTIQMVMALMPLHREWGLEVVRVATYQAVSGAGYQALAEMETGTRASLAAEGPTAEREPAPAAFAHPIAFEALPHVGEFVDDETTEEIKMREESRRLLDLPELQVSATCVRVPVRRGHSEAVWAQFREIPDPKAARSYLQDFGIVVQDAPQESLYPRARTSALSGDVFVGRIRKDGTHPHGLCMWVVSDNLLKGAALNAVQIAEHIVRQGWVG